MQYSRELLNTAALAFIFKIIGMGSALALNVAVARTLGAEGAGLFFLSFTIVFIVAACCRLGFENYIVRQVSYNNALNNLGANRRLYYDSMIACGVLSVCISLLLIYLSPLVCQILFKKPELTPALTIMSFAVAPLSLSVLQGHFLQGLKKTTLAIAVLSIGIPLLSSIIIALSNSPTVELAASSFLLSTLLTFVIACVAANRHLGRNNCPCPEPKMAQRLSRITKRSVPFFVVVLCGLVLRWSPILFLGAWASSSELGAFNAAYRTAMLTSFILVAINIVAAPRFSEFVAREERAQLKAISNQASLLGFVLALPIVFVFVFYADYVMSVFGKEFISAATLLGILAFGQFVNVISGPVGTLLMMSNHERLVMANMLFCSFLSVLAGLIIIPVFGIIGAAWSIATIVVIQNLILLCAARYKLGFWIIPRINYGKKYSLLHRISR